MIPAVAPNTEHDRPLKVFPCPQCGNVKSYVIDVRSRKDGSARRRRYQCNRCQLRYTTYEVRAEEYEKRVNGDSNGHR